MVEYNLGAGLVGAILGILALPCFAYFLKELVVGRTRWRAISISVGLLFGAAIASGPIGNLALSETLWPWFVVGEAATFLPVGIIITIRYIFKS